MIVRVHETSLTLVTQPDHAVLSAQLMAGWLAEGFATRPTREAALFATAEHDVGWHLEDGAPNLDPSTGRPYHFTALPDERRRAIWPRGVSRLSGRSTYAAALVAQHALTIHREHRTDPAWQEFFKTLERERDRWYTAEPHPAPGAGPMLDPHGPDRLSFLQDYATVRMGDLLSLSFCNGWTDPIEREGYAIRTEGDQLLVTPDPFGGCSLSFNVPARRLPPGPYTSDEHLREALRNAEPCLLTGRAVGTALP